jgi:hypothetical protein
MQRSDATPKNHLPPNTGSTDVEKPCPRTSEKVESENESLTLGRSA